MALSLSLFPPPRLCLACRMYAAMSVPPRHPRHPAGDCQRPSTGPNLPVSPTPAVLRQRSPQQMLEGLRQQLHQRALVRKPYRSPTVRMTADPARGRYRLMVRSPECRHSVGLLSPPPSQPSLRASLLGSRNISATYLQRAGVRARTLADWRIYFTHLFHHLYTGDRSKYHTYKVHIELNYG